MAAVDLSQQQEVVAMGSSSASEGVRGGLRFLNIQIGLARYESFHAPSRLRDVPTVVC